MIFARLKVGVMDPSSKEFEENDSYDLEAHESVNGLLEANHSHEDDECNHAILELVFPMGEVTLLSVKKIQTRSAQGKLKVRWRLT
jgi:hypothetical protein